MIISRTPFRVSFAGGGSDLPAFFEQAEGAVVSTTIDKYMYIAVHPNFYPDQILLKYSKTESVTNPKDLQNNVARSVLSETKIKGIEVESIGDVPAQTGLGSSSAFAVGLHHVLNEYLGKKVTPEKLAQKACTTEIKKLGSPIGKQDQYAAAYGGLNFYRFLANGTVTVEPIKMKPETKQKLEKNVLMFYTGITRPANTILETQKDNLQNSPDVVATTHHMVALAYHVKEVLEEGNLKKFGELLHDGWLLKRSCARAITNPTIDEYYERGLAAGATGGKLLGAGGGGFLLFYCEQKKQESLRKALKELREVPFSFTDQGSEIIFKS